MPWPIIAFCLVAWAIAGVALLTGFTLALQEQHGVRDVRLKGLTRRNRVTLYTICVLGGGIVWFMLVLVTIRCLLNWAAAPAKVVDSE